MKNFCKFVCCGGWFFAIVMSIVAFLCELRRQIAVEQAGLLRANLGSYRAQLDRFESLSKNQRLPDYDPFSRVLRLRAVE